MGRWWALLPALIVLGGYWLLPISGQVLIIPGPPAPIAWPRIEVERGAPNERWALRVTDVVPWAYVLLTVDGQPAELEQVAPSPSGTWTWQWRAAQKRGEPPFEASGAEVVFYRDCDDGCRERGRLVVAAPDSAPAPASRAGPSTKLGVVFANPERDWHGRSGWDVELTYVRPGAEPHWGIDALAARVAGTAAKGLRVLVRVDYDRGQSLPPPNDPLALGEYLRYVGRLARDDRLRPVYGYVVGSGYNALDGNTLSPEQPVTPAWYARVFNGYGLPAGRDDNVLQTVRAENPSARVLVGPVRPWVADQTAELRYAIDVPWLNYMYALVGALDEGARAKAAAEIALMAPDGFALQAPGRPSAPELAGRDGAMEPGLDLPRAAWGGAQAGFRVYRDWQGIVNAYPTTRGLPLYITASNTFAPDDGTPPAQNYPPGWLSAAAKEVDDQPQVMALTWFLDGPLGDKQWDAFSLGRRLGRLIDAAKELDALLQGGR